MQMIPIPIFHSSLPSLASLLKIQVLPLELLNMCRPSHPFAKQLHQRASLRNQGLASSDPSP